MIRNKTLGHHQLVDRITGSIFTIKKTIPIGYLLFGISEIIKVVFTSDGAQLDKQSQMAKIPSCKDLNPCPPCTPGSRSSIGHIGKDLERNQVRLETKLSWQPHRCIFNQNLDKGDSFFKFASSPKNQKLKTIFEQKYQKLLRCNNKD